MEDFSCGFTEKSYFNIYKSIIYELYQNSPGKERLDFKYHDDKEINAWVGYNSLTNEDILTINVGTVVDIFAMMKTAFAQTDILVNLGDSTRENNQIIDGKFIGYSHSIIYNGKVLNDIRSSLADYTSLIALRFIFSHELGHILNGHTKLLKSIYMNSKIEMRLESVFNNERYCLDRRTLEMDADASAATSSIDNIIMLYYRHKNDYIFSLLSKPEDIFSLWGFAISCIFFKFESMKKTSFDKYSLYLPNELRYVMVLESAYETAKTYMSYKFVNELYKDRDKILAAVYYGIEQAQLYFRKIYYRDYRWINQTRDGLSRTFRKEVLDNWDNRLYYKLQSYSRAPLYLPNKIDEIVEMLKKYEEKSGHSEICG